LAIVVKIGASSFAVDPIMTLTVSGKIEKESTMRKNRNIKDKFVFMDLAGYIYQKNVMTTENRKAKLFYIYL